MLSQLQLRHAAHQLRRGEVLAYPTEAVFGLGCDPRNPNAVSQLLAIKRRDWRKGVILIAADFTQLQPFLAPLSKALSKQVFDTWPGPVTWVLPAAPNTPAWLTGGRPSLAVRVTAHAPAAALCRAFGGALVSTSANRSGQAPATSWQQIRKVFGPQLPVLPGQCGGLEKPTQIRNGLNGGERLR